MKPAGFEPVEVRSGYTGNDLGAYVEFRDNRVVFFARTLARGKHSVSYRMRAEIPGKFSALPTRAQAMYAPELKATRTRSSCRDRAIELLPRQGSKSGWNVTRSKVLAYNAFLACRGNQFLELQWEMSRDE